MFTGTLIADLLLGDVHSLKGKRAVVRPIVAELRRRFAVAAAEVGDLESFGADVRDAMAEREQELRAGTGLDAPLPAVGDAAAQRRGAHSAD